MTFLEMLHALENTMSTAVTSVVPDKFYLAKSSCYGDCFISSISISINKLNNTNKNTVKSLRLLCEISIKNSWWYQQIVLNNLHPQYGDPNFKTYCDFVKFTSDELHAKQISIAPEFKIGMAVGSRPEREGVLFCSEFKVNLHIIKINGKNNNAISEYLITESGCQRIEKMDEKNYENKNIVHLANFTGENCSHCMPILMK